MFWDNAALAGYIWLLYDLLALVLLFYFVRTSAAKGFVRTLISFSGYMVAAAVAGSLGPALAQLLYDNVVRDLLRIAILRQAEAVLADGAQAAAGDVADFLPGLLRLLVQGTGSQVLEAVFDGNTEAMVDMVLDGVLRSPVLSILGGVSFFLVFSLALFAARHIGRLFTGLYRVPVIGPCNTFLGGIVGVGQGLLVLWFSAILFHLAITVTGGQIPWLNEDIIESTFIYRFFYKLS